MQTTTPSSGQNASHCLAAAALEAILVLFDDWIARAVSIPALEWYRRTIEDLRRAGDATQLAMAIGTAPRRLGRSDLVLTAKDLERAGTLRPNFDPRHLSVDQLARIAFTVASYRGDDGGFASWFDKFCATAGINELIALCRGLPVYPAATLLEPRAREAVRSGMKPVFEAVVHYSPYPAEYFAEEAWNQMVVKAIFIGSSLWPIQSLDQRRNGHLARMLVDLAQERWAAGRPVSAEVWRCVASHADAAGDAALVRAFETGGDKDQLAVALALQQGAEDRVDLLFEKPGLREKVRQLQSRLIAERIGWEALA